MINTIQFEIIRKRILNVLDHQQNCSDEVVFQQIESMVLNSNEFKHITAGEKQKIIRQIYDGIRGYDVLQSLIDEPTITEIMVNSHDCIFIERRGAIERSSIQFDNEQKLIELIRSIVGKVNRVVTESSPIVDARLHDGSRVHVVLPPVALQGPTMTIRKFPEQHLTMKDLLTLGTLSDEAAQFLKEVVQAKYNIFIGGGTGSGKTTILNVLTQSIPEDERIITIEDVAELQINHLDNLVRLETRNANMEGKGTISIRELIRASLRMRPNRIIVGEVRGPEAFDMLQAMNTGHDGSLSTGHANSSKDMITRLETMILAAASLPIEVIRQQIASAIDIVVHISRLRDKSRRVTEIHEIVGVKNGEVILQPIFLFKESTTSSMNQVTGSLQRTGYRLQNQMKIRAIGMEEGKW
jgi:pilus assembly protein CpaF